MHILSTDSFKALGKSVPYAELTACGSVECACEEGGGRGGGVVWWWEKRVCWVGWREREGEGREAGRQAGRGWWDGRGGRRRGKRREDCRKDEELVSDVKRRQPIQGISLRDIRGSFAGSLGYTR